MLNLQKILQYNLFAVLIIYFGQKVSIVEMILLELFCLLVKNMIAAFYRSLEVMRIFGRKKSKFIMFSHTIFLNEFSQHISVSCGLHDVAN